MSEQELYWTRLQSIANKCQREKQNQNQPVFLNLGFELGAGALTPASTCQGFNVSMIWWELGCIYRLRHWWVLTFFCPAPGAHPVSRCSQRCRGWAASAVNLGFGSVCPGSFVRLFGFKQREEIAKSFLPWVLSVVGLAFSRASVAEHLPFSAAPNCRTGSYRNMASRSWKNFMVLVASPELWAYLTVLYSYLRFLYFARHCFQSLQTPNSCSLLAM